MSSSHATSRWDWNGIIGTGQSLSVGERPVLSTAKSAPNLMLSLGAAEVPPWDPEQRELRMVPLVEPLRPLATDFPSPYPRNLFGETLHGAMAAEITALAERDRPGSEYLTVHSVVGESGQPMIALRKRPDTTGVAGRAYAAALFETAAIARLARAAGKSFGVRALVLTHGESDWARPEYGGEAVELLDEVNRDLRALTGQSEPIVVLLSQPFAFPGGLGERIDPVQWRLGVERPDAFVCTGPKYQYLGIGDGVHLAALGYQALGEKTGQVYCERFVRGRAWRPLEPVSAEGAGRNVTVRFRVPVPPLRFDETLDDAVLWPKGRGFELYVGTERLGIDSVNIEGGHCVVVRCERDLPSRGVTVSYALTSAGVQMGTGSRAYRWGKLRDSDPFVGSTTRMPQANYCVSFEMPVVS